MGTGGFPLVEGGGKEEVAGEEVEEGEDVEEGEGDEEGEEGGEVEEEEVSETSHSIPKKGFLEGSPSPFFPLALYGAG